MTVGMDSEADVVLTVGAEVGEAVACDLINDRVLQMLANAPLETRTAETQIAIAGDLCAVEGTNEESEDASSQNQAPHAPIPEAAVHLEVARTPIEADERGREPDRHAGPKTDISRDHVAAHDLSLRNDIRLHQSVGGIHRHEAGHPLVADAPLLPR